MIKRRAVESACAMVKARVVLGHRSSTIECHVRNMTSVGALIQLPGVLALPNDFDLLIPDANISCRARLRWLEGARAGVAFVDDISKAAGAA